MNKRVLYFVVSLIVSLALTWLVKEPDFTQSKIYVLFLTFFSIALWVTEAVPAFAVSLFIMAYLVFTLGNPYFNNNPEQIDKYVHTFSSSTIWLLLGGFFLSSAMTKTKLDEKLLRITFKISGTQPRNIIIAIVSSCAILSSMMSNASTSAMMVAALMPLLDKLGKSKLTTGLLLAIALGCATGGIATIIGTPANAIAAGMLESDQIPMDFMKWVTYGLPITVILAILGSFLLVRLYVENAEPITMNFLSISNDQSDPSPQNRKIVLWVLVITVILWLTNSIHHVSVAAISAIPFVVLTLTGVLDEKDVKALPWNVLILVAGGMSLGVALESSGLLTHYATYISNMKLSPTIFILVFAYIAMFISNFMSNSVAATILLPFEFAIFPDYRLQLAVTTAIATSCGLFLPVSNPPNALIYSTSYLKIKDFRSLAFLIALVGPILAVIWVKLLAS
ncbi:MAG: hypothetical protein C5B52_09770 [Bacteroidetes bacterium]|nr:MAG: hypothetical protein C5B52_09770 [Bacteroidota bacterium]